jgi:NAD(P)-dependent dehydrogenase (short-subunit alcohol dehydrogenase family)
MTKPLAGRIALVTGASRGIGAAAALALAAEGAHIVAVARTTGGLEELDDGITAAGGTATLVPLDVKDTDGILRLALALNERHGRLDILVGNAGVLGTPSPLAHVEPKVWDDTLAINVTANWHLLRALDPLLKRSDAGRAVFVTSGLATKALPYFGAYAVSKAALGMLVRTYAAEVASTPVRVNLFNPGRTRTKMMAVAFPGLDPQTLPPAEEVVAALVPLCHPDCTENGRLYDVPTGRFQDFQQPA